MSAGIWGCHDGEIREDVQYPTASDGPSTEPHAPTHGRLSTQPAPNKQLGLGDRAALGVRRC